jgi:hypothetical protein
MVHLSALTIYDRQKCMQVEEDFEDCSDAIVNNLPLLRPKTNHVTLCEYPLPSIYR